MCIRKVICSLAAGAYARSVETDRLRQPPRVLLLIKPAAARGYVFICSGAVSRDLRIRFRGCVYIHSLVSGYVYGILDSRVCVSAGMTRNADFIFRLEKLI